MNQKDPWEGERDEQLITDILLAVDEALEANGREPMDIIDGVTVDDLRDAVWREVSRRG